MKRRKKISIIFSSILLILIAICLCIKIYYKNTTKKASNNIVYVNKAINDYQFVKSKANVYSKPNDKSNVIKVFKPNSKVFIQGKTSDGWYEVSSDKGLGYIKGNIKISDTDSDNEIQKVSSKSLPSKYLKKETESFNKALVDCYACQCVGGNFYNALINYINTNSIKEGIKEDIMETTGKVEQVSCNYTLKSDYTIQDVSDCGLNKKFQDGGYTNYVILTKNNDGTVKITWYHLDVKFI